MLVHVGDFTKNPNIFYQNITAQAIYHQEYNSSNLVNDIALVNLSEPVPRSRILKMCDRSYLGEGILAACGMGRTEIEDPDIDASVLQEVKTIESENPEICNTDPDYPEFDYKPEIQVCTADDNNNDLSELTCHGDSGGPLYPLDAQNKPVCLYGLTSYGDPYCIGPGDIFTRVSAYLDWIKINME